MKVYVDTNILVDFVCKRKDFFADARNLFAYGYAKVFALQTSAVSFVTTMYLAHKYDYEDVEKGLLKVATFVDVLDLKGETVEWALSSGWKDYEDATQFKTADLSQADCIVTRNKKDFKKSTIPVFTVKELFAHENIQVSAPKDSKKNKDSVEGDKEQAENDNVETAH